VFAPLQSTFQDWAALRGARIFITGGTGLFGHWLLPLLCQANQAHGLGLQLTVLSRQPARFLAAHPELAADPALRFVPGDVRDFAFPAGRFSHVIHGAATAAAATFHRQEDALTKFDTTYAGTRRVLDFMAERAIPRLLVLGSGAYYGPLQPGWDAYPEDYPIAPAPENLDVAIGHAKRAAEFLCAAYAARHGFSYSVARCFAFVGPHLPLDLHYAIGNFIRDALDAPAITVGGDGSPIRAYMYLGDLMEWLLTLLIRGAPGRAYNVGSDEAISIGALARRVGALLAPDKPVHILGTPSGMPTRNIYLPDIGRARAELGLTLRTSLDDAIRITARHAAPQRPN
jgi:UDP-glucuronate decarboxylase